MGKIKVEKWECLRQDPRSSGFEVGGIYESSKINGWEKSSKDKICLLNKRRNQQIVNKEYFKLVKP